MRLIQLIETLERLADTRRLPDPDERAELAGLAEELRDAAADVTRAWFEKHKQDTPILPGSVHVDHAIRVGLEETLDAHAQVKAMRHTGTK